MKKIKYMLLVVALGLSVMAKPCDRAYASIESKTEADSASTSKDTETESESETETDTEKETTTEQVWYNVEIVNNWKQIALKPNETYNIELNGKPIVKQVKYTSSDKTVVAVTKTGKVRAKGIGTATIYISGTDTYGNTFYGEQYIGVTNPSIKKSYLIFNMYDSYKEISSGYYVNNNSYITVNGVNANTNIVVKTSSSKIRIIDSYSLNENGERLLYIQAKKTGTYNVTIKIDGKTFKRKIYVKKIYFKRNAKTICDGKSKKWIEGSSMICLYKGEKTTLSINGIKNTKSIVWTSDNEAVATVDSNGKVKAVSMGYANITATYGNVSLTYKIGVSYKNSVLALRYAFVHLGDTYSQANRMEEGKYDCSSYAWRSYDSAGMNVGGLNNWAPTAADMAKWCVDNGYMIMMGTINVDDMLPGDLVFWCGEDNGRYYGIYHVDIYEGNSTIITVESEGGIYNGAYNVLVARPCEKSNSVIKKIRPYTYVKEVKKTQISFTWTKFCDVSGYKIYRKTGDGKYKLIKTIKGSDNNTYTDKKLKSNKSYSYKIKAYKVVNGKTIYSKVSEEIFK